MLLAPATILATHAQVDPFWFGLFALTVIAIVLADRGSRED